MSQLRQDKSGGVLEDVTNQPDTNQPVTNQEKPPSGSGSGSNQPVTNQQATNQQATNQEKPPSGSGATDHNPTVARALNLITDTFDALDFGSLVAEPVNTIGGRHLVEDPVLSEIVRQEIHLQQLEDEEKPQQEDTSSLSSLGSIFTQPNTTSTSSGISSLPPKTTQDILCEEVRHELLADLIGGGDEEENREPQPGNQEVWCEEVRQEILAQLNGDEDEEVHIEPEDTGRVISLSSASTQAFIHEEYNDSSTEEGTSFSQNNDSYLQEDENSQQHASDSYPESNLFFESVEDLHRYIEAQNGDSTQDSGIIVDFIDLTESDSESDSDVEYVDTYPFPIEDLYSSSESEIEGEPAPDSESSGESEASEEDSEEGVIYRFKKYYPKTAKPQALENIDLAIPQEQGELDEEPKTHVVQPKAEEPNKPDSPKKADQPSATKTPSAQKRKIVEDSLIAKRPKYNQEKTEAGQVSEERPGHQNEEQKRPEQSPQADIPPVSEEGPGHQPSEEQNQSQEGPTENSGALPDPNPEPEAELRRKHPRKSPAAIDICQKDVDVKESHRRKETEAAVVANKERQAALRQVASKRQLEEPTGDSGKLTQNAVKTPRLSGYTGFGIYNPSPPQQRELQQRFRKQQEELWVRQQEVDKIRAEHLKKQEEEEKEKVRLKKQELDIQRQLRLQREQYQLKLKEQEELRVKQLDPNYKPPIKVTKAELQRQQIQRNKQKKEEEKRKFREQQLGLQKQQPSKELMQNDMVSIPAANMNGGLKAASAGSAVVTASGVPSSVLANAPRVFLTNASSAFMVGNRTGSATVTATATAASSSTGSAAGAVRYFSQFGKIQKSPNLDTILMANGIGTPIKTTNGSLNTTALLSSNKMDFLDSDADLSTVIIEEPESEDSRKSAASDPSSQQQQESQLDKKSLNPEAQPKSDEPLELTQLSNSNSATAAPGQAAGPDEPQPELDIVINNVVCSFSVRCHLKLREIALNGANVEYRRENGMVTMKLRHPYTTASIWSSGRITCTGATSEPMAKVAARRYARCLGKLGFPTRFQNFRIVNVLGTCSMPWAIKIVNFSERHRENASYEPELHPGVTYKMRDPKATLKIFSTGSITVTAASVNDVEAAIQHIYPLVFEFRKQRSAEELLHLRSKQKHLAGADPSELEELIMNENKAAGDNNIFVNTQPAHGKSESAASATALSTSSINSVQRLKQFENYVQVVNQTQDERRHIPFQGDSSAKSSSTAAGTASSSSSTGDNICANARRRATECWASKLQNKRTRYNNIAPAEPATSSSGTAVVRNPLKAAALANAKPRNATGTSGKIPVSQVLKQSSSRARNAQLQQQQQQQQQQQLEQHQVVQVVQCPKVRSSPAFEPTDFEIDDLIEEEDPNEFGLSY